jgi:hypothetical protein
MVNLVINVVVNSYVFGSYKMYSSLLLRNETLQHLINDGIHSFSL